MRVFKLLETWITNLSKGLKWASTIAYAAMMFLVSAHVLMRYFFRVPLTGTYDIMAFMMLIGANFSLAWVQNKKGHISIDLIKYPKPAWLVINAVNMLLCAGMTLVICWRSIIEAQIRYLSHAATGVLGIPPYPFLYLIAIWFFVFGLMLLLDIFRPYRKKEAHK